MTRRIGWSLLVTGALVQTGGLALDAWMHAQDASLAAREGLFARAHLVMLAGMVAVGVGAAAVVLDWLRTPGRAKAAVAGGGAFLVGLASFATVAAVAAPSEDAHVHVHREVQTINAVAASVEHGHGHEPSGSEPMERTVRDALAAQLVTARAVAARYPTVSDAERDGYRKVTQYVPLLGAHYMKFSVVDGKFDVMHPEMVLYDGTEPGSRIVGLSYYVSGTTIEPTGFAGPNDHWHRHIGLCIDPKRIFVIGDEKTSESECRARGGVKADGSDAWMVHAWVVPGWDSPQGVFSAENPLLR